MLNEKSKILGVAHRKLDDQDLRILTQEILEFAGLEIGEFYSPQCNKCLLYQSIDQESFDDYIKQAT